MTIGKNIIGTIAGSVRALLMENLAELDQAYLKAEGPIDISLRVRLKPSVDVKGDVEVNTNLSFVLERVKADMGVTLSENQGLLFKKEDDLDLDPEGDDAE